MTRDCVQSMSGLLLPAPDLHMRFNGLNDSMMVSVFHQISSRPAAPPKLTKHTPLHPINTNYDSSATEWLLY